MWKISSFFSISSFSSCLCSYIFTSPARICHVPMSHKWIWVRDQAAIVMSRRSRPFFQLFHLVTYHLARFGGFVSLPPRVGSVGFRSPMQTLLKLVTSSFPIGGRTRDKHKNVCVRFVVSGFSPRGFRDFKWRGWSNGAKSQNPKRSLGLPAKPKNIPGPKINPK